MKNLIYALFSLALLSSCNKKPVKQGSVTYSLEYQLPDTLKKYVDFLPKTALVYFKGDSTVSIQQGSGESTTVITYKPTGFMRVLLKSPFQKYQVDYSKADQSQEKASLPVYSYKASADTRIIAGHRTIKYVLTDKATGETAEAWYTKEISIVPNSLTTALDTTYGVPLAFTTNQHGMVIKTTAKQVKFDPIAGGVFATPAGYQTITPKQLQEMPVEN